MSDRRDYLLQAAHDVHTHLGGQSLDDTADVLGGIVQHFEAPLQEALRRRQAQRDTARDIAIDLESQLARIAELHQGYDYGVGEDHHGRLCRECSVEWPCPTARSAGADVLIDDQLIDLLATEGDPF